MAVQHTPGPWLINHDLLKGGHILVHSADYGVAKVYDEESGSRAINEANARLIAAAPDLLAAAQVALETLAPSQDDDFVWAAMTQLTAAIAKAEGRS